MVLQLKTPEDLVDLYVGIAIVRYSLGIAVVTINGGILLAFLIQRWRCRKRHPKRRLHPSGCFVINLLIADTFVGAVWLVALPFKIWPENAVLLARRQYLCLLRFAIEFLAVCGSHNALLSVAIDRYMAVVHTLRYRDWMTTKTCVLMIIASWILPVTGWMYLMVFGNWYPNMPTCNENTVLANFALYVWLPIQIVLLLSIVVIQICVHFELKRYGRLKSVSSRILRRSSHKSARVMLISTMSFGLVYGPYDASAIVFAFFPSATSKLFYDLFGIGAASTFMVNPCLYSFKTESVRRPVTDFFADLRGGLTLILSKKPRKYNEKKCEPGPNEPALENPFIVFRTNRTCSSATLTTSLGGALV